VKKQDSSKGFKIFYYIISALWMVWWGLILYLTADNQERRIFAFFIMLLPIPIYYILKGFFIGSKKIMNLPKYILIIAVLVIVAFVGWNKIDTSVKDKELYVECIFSSDTNGNQSGIIDISNGQMCFIDPSGNDPKLCAKVLKFNSDFVQSINLHPSTDAMAALITEGASADVLNKEMYVKLDRRTGKLSFHWASNDKNIDPKKGNFFINCKRKERL
jgi:hypothetical protein